MTDEWRIRERLEYILETSCSPEAACAECPELLPKVKQRLERLRQVERRIDVIFPSTSSVAEKTKRIGTSASDKLPQIEGYQVEAILGRGGMGVVYTAKHLKLNRIVALKMLLAGPYASPVEISRFVRESQLVAELQHPHIVQIHDVGDLDGRPYFTMEFVEGGSLAKKLAGAPQPARSSAELVVALAKAVHLAHAKGIIHRDLKPANILLSDSGTPKIADFGLARHIHGDSDLTMSDARVGTPSYMAPEQALGKLGSVGSSIDIYALGAILYEMLTGRPPFRAETAIETQRQVITVEPPPPSRLNANVPRDLETICLKCLHKDPARRYASAAELADDFERFLNGQPVVARPVGWLERVTRWGARNKAVATALAGIALLLTFICVGSLWTAAHFRQLEREQRNLVQEKEHQREKAVLAEQREIGLHQQAQAQSEKLRRNLYLTEMNLAGQATTVASGLGRVGELLARWDDAKQDLRGWEWYYLNGLCQRSLSTRFGHLGVVHKVAWNPAGTRLASASADHTVAIWDATDERAPLRLIGHEREILGIAWSPDGLRLATASWDRTVRVWDALTGSQIFKFDRHTSEVFCVAWSPDGSTIASGGADQAIQIWNAADGASKHVLSGHEQTVACLDWSADNQQLVSSSRDATIRIWDAAAGKPIRTIVGHTNWVNHVTWSPDGTKLASASNDQTLRVWDSAQGSELLKLRGHTQGISSVAWSPDGKSLASSSDDQTVKLWSATEATEYLTLRGHAGPLTSVAWNSKGDRLASAGYDKTVRIWDAATLPEVPVLKGHRSTVITLAWSQQVPSLCASADDSGFILGWDVARQSVRWTLRADEKPIMSLAWHPAGTRLAAASANGLIRVWNTATQKDPLVLEAHGGAVYSVAWSPNGRQLASVGADKKIRIWDMGSATCLRTIEKHEYLVYAVAWSPDGQRLASASGDRTVKIWDAATGQEIHTLREHPSEVKTISWSPDGTKIAAAGYDQNLHLWDAISGQRISELRGHTTDIVQVQWCPDGSRLASASRDGSVKIWDIVTGAEALTLDRLGSQVNTISWSPDGMILASAGEDHQIHLHDARQGYTSAKHLLSLAFLERHRFADSANAEGCRMRAEIHARHHNWQLAAQELRQYLIHKTDTTFLMLDGLVAGPYPQDLNVRCAPEDAEFLHAKIQNPDNRQAPSPVTWKTVPGSAQGIMDFGLLMDHKEHISAYATFPIYSLEDQQVAFLLGTDDQARLWLNGKQLFESLRNRPAVHDEDAVLGNLNAGWNILLVRVNNESDSHTLFLRLSNGAAELARVRASAK